MGYYLETTDCEKNENGNHLCVEFTNADHERIAACVASLNPCPPGVERICLDSTTLAGCHTGTGYPSVQYCEYFCVYTANGNAECAYLDTQCRSGDKRCITGVGDKSTHWASCRDNGIFSACSSCPPNEVCEQVSPSEITCVPE
jgi:hypothetical protein